MSIPSASRKSGASCRRSRTGGCGRDREGPLRHPRFQEHQHGATAAGVARRFAVREDLVALREPVPYLRLEHGLAIWRGETLAVDDAHAAPAAAARLEQEVRQSIARFFAC